jgi:hypothetical protein
LNFRGFQNLRSIKKTPTAENSQNKLTLIHFPVLNHFT